MLAWSIEMALPLVRELFSLKSQIEDRSVVLIGGLVRAGTNFNVVPDTCTFTIDRRFNPDEDRGVERQRLFDIIERGRSVGIEVDVRVVQEGSPASTPPNSELAMALDEAIHTVTGRSASFEMCPGLLELRFYADRRVPALAYGPGLLEVSHGPKEFVKISRIIECAKIYALAAVRLLSQRKH